MSENLYPKLPSAPSMSQESFSIETVRKYYQNITDLKNKCHKKHQKYKNAYNKLLHASTGASSFALISGISTQPMYQIYLPVPKYIPRPNASMSLFAKPNDIHQADILYPPYDRYEKKTYKYVLNIVGVASRCKGS